jgi:pilus assembly protein CpaE
MLATPHRTDASAASHTAGDSRDSIVARIFVTDQESESVIRESLSALGVQGAHFTTGDVSAAIAALAKEDSPHLLVVDISGIADPLSRMRDLAEVCGPNISVVVIGDRNDIVFYRELKSMGTSEYFLKPLVRSLFTGTCKSILAPERGQAHTRSGGLVYVLGVRGGTGATTIATNLAWRLAETKRRHTILVDLDLQEGDAALQLDAQGNHALREALDHPERVDKLFLERGVKHVTDRLHLLCSLEPLESTPKLAEEAFLWLLDKLLPRYRLTIVETTPSVAVNMTWALRLPSTCLIVSNPSLAGARDLARWNEILGPNTPDRHTVVILNHPTAHGGLSLADFTRASGRAPDVNIPYDRELAEAAPLGIHAMQKCKAFQKSLSRIVRDFTGEETEEKQSFLSRILG